jgi:hypothetical protein
LSVVRLGMFWFKKTDIGKSWIYLLVMLIGVGLVSYTGHLGGVMVHPANETQSIGLQQSK